MADQEIRINVKVTDNVDQVQKKIDALGEDELISGKGRSGGLGYDVAEPNTRPIPQAPQRMSILNNPNGMMGYAGPYGEYGGGILNEPASLRAYNPKVLPDPLKASSADVRAGLIYDPANDRKESPLQNYQRLTQEENAANSLKNFRDDSKYDRLQRTNYFPGAGYSERTASPFDKKQVRPSEMADWRDEVDNYKAQNASRPLSQQAIRDAEEARRNAQAATNAPAFISAAQQYKNNRDSAKLDSERKLIEGQLKDSNVLSPNELNNPAVKKVLENFKANQSNARAGLIGEGENSKGLNSAGMDQAQAKEHFEKDLFYKTYDQKFDSFKEKALKENPASTDKDIEGAFAKTNPYGELNDKLDDSKLKAEKDAEELVVKENKERVQILNKLKEQNKVEQDKLIEERKQAKALLDNKLATAKDNIGPVNNPVKYLEQRKSAKNASDNAFQGFEKDITGISDKQKALDKEAELIDQQIKSLGNEAEAQETVNKKVEKTSTSKKEMGRVDSSNSANIKKFLQLEGTDRENLINQISLQRKVVEELNKQGDAQPAAIARANRELASLIAKEQELNLTEAKSANNLERRNELTAKNVALVQEETALRAKADLLTNTDSNNRRTPFGKGVQQGFQAATQTDEVGSFFGTGGMEGFTGAVAGLAVAGAAMLGVAQSMDELKKSIDYLKEQGTKFTDNGGPIDQQKKYDQDKAAADAKQAKDLANSGSALGYEQTTDKGKNLWDSTFGALINGLGTVLNAAGKAEDEAAKKKAANPLAGGAFSGNWQDNAIEMSKRGGIKPFWVNDEDWAKQQQDKKNGPVLTANADQVKIAETLAAKHADDEKKLAQSRLDFEQQIADKRQALTAKIADYELGVARQREDIATSRKQENEDYSLNKSQLLEDRAFKASEQKREMDKASAKRDFANKQADENAGLETKIKYRAEDIATQTGDERRDLDTSQRYGREDLATKQQNDQRDFDLGQKRASRDLNKSMGDNTSNFVVDSAHTLEDFKDNVNDIGLHNGSAIDYLTASRDARKNISRSQEQLGITNSRMARDAIDKKRDNLKDFKLKQGDETVNLSIDEKRQREAQATKEADRLRDNNIKNGRDRDDLKTKQSQDSRDFDLKNADDDAKHAIDVQQHQIDLQEKLNDLETNHSRNLEKLDIATKRLNEDFEKMEKQFSGQKDQINKDEKTGLDALTSQDGAQNKQASDENKTAYDTLTKGMTEDEKKFFDKNNPQFAGMKNGADFNKDTSGGNASFTGYKSAEEESADQSKAFADPKAFAKLPDWKDRVDQWGNDKRLAFYAALDGKAPQDKTSKEAKDSGGYIGETKDYLLHEGEYVVNPRSTNPARQMSYAEAAVGTIQGKAALGDAVKATPIANNGYAETSKIAMGSEKQNYDNNQSNISIGGITVNAGSGFTQEDANALAKDIKGYADERARYYSDQARGRASQDFSRNMTSISRSRE